MDRLREQGPCMAPEAMQGPTEHSNFVVPDAVIVGPAPSPHNRDDMLTLVDFGCRWFIDVRSLPQDCTRAVESATGEELRYTHFDLRTHITKQASNIAVEFCSLLLAAVEYGVQTAGQVYLYDDDGHGLCMVAACGLLSVTYGLSGPKAVNGASRLHACRVKDEGVFQFVTDVHQKAFVRDMASVTVAQIYALRERENATTVAAAAPTDSVSSGMEVGTAARWSAPGDSASAQPAAAATPLASLPTGSRAVSLPALSPIDAGPVLVTNAALLGQAAALSPAKRHIDPSAPPSAAGTPISRPVSARFAASKGCGGGQTHINLFSQEVTELTPTKRGRGLVHGMSAESLTASLKAAGISTTSSPVSPPVPTTSEAMVAGRGAAVNAALPSAPPIFSPSVDRALVAGPTSTSNWIVRGRVCVGSRPSPMTRQFQALVAAKFTHFVSLEEEADFIRFPYVAEYEKAAGRKVTSVHHPMVDGAAPKVPSEVHEVLDLAKGIVRLVVGRVDEGRQENGGAVVYLHCRNGHGRVGIVGSIILGLMYGLSGMRAVNLNDALHECRADPEGQRSPQTQEQRMFVIGLISSAPSGSAAA